MRYSLFVIACAAAALTGCTGGNTSPSTAVLPDTVRTVKPVPGKPAAKTSCDSVLPLAEVKTALKRWEDFYAKKQAAFQLSSFRFSGCSDDAVYSGQDDTVPQEELMLYKHLFVFSPDREKFIDLDTYNFFLSKDKSGRLLGETGDPETEVALVDTVHRQRFRLSFTGPGTIAEDAAWIGNNKIVLAYTADTDGRFKFFSPYIVLIDLTTQTASVFSSGIKIDLAATGDYTNLVRWKGIRMK